MVETESGEVYLGELFSDGEMLLVYTGFRGRPKELWNEDVVSVVAADAHPDCSVEWMSR